MKYESKFKVGDEVFIVLQPRIGTWEIRESRITSVTFRDKITVRYGVGLATYEESEIVKYDKDALFEYLDKHLHVNEEVK